MKWWPLKEAGSQEVPVTVALAGCNSSMPFSAGTALAVAQASDSFRSANRSCRVKMSAMNEVNPPPAPSTSCPRCGFDGPSDSECSRCGIVYAKIRQGEGLSASASTKRAPQAAGGPGTEPTRFTLLPWLIALLAVFAVAAGFDALRQGDPAPGETQRLSADPPTTEVAPLVVEPVRSVVPATDPMPDLEATWTSVDGPDVLAEPAPEPPRVVTPSYSWYEGASGFERGVEESKREGKVLAVYFYTDWCPYCRELDRELLTRAKVEEFLKYLVKIRVNPESGRRERMLANEYGVRGYPSFFIQSTPDAAPSKIRRTSSDGLKSPEEFVATLERAARSSK